jgi:hypothetical protein
MSEAFVDSKSLVGAAWGAASMGVAVLVGGGGIGAALIGGSEVTDPLCGAEALVTEDPLVGSKLNGR